MEQPTERSAETAAPAPSAASVGTLLDIHDVSRSFGGVLAVDRASAGFVQGQITGIIGPNGAGKSTLLRMAAGITLPTAGEVRIFGHSPQEQTVEVLRQIGYLDQERPLYRSFRVEEMLRFGRKLNPTWDDTAARGYLA
jgi:ABC-2 type transport system ATP-binding protein